MIFLKPWIYQTHKMYRGLIFMIAICSVNGFNIQPLPVKHFTNEDPLFGQTVIQSSEGVFVASPTTGELYKCTLEENCVVVNSHNEPRNGLRPIASVASRVISDEEHFLVCNQVRTKKSTTEYLNGNCAIMNPKGKVHLNPADLVSKQNARQNRNNNNNRNHGQQIDKVHQRMKRDAQETTDTDDNDDAGTEIAFVLDGSGSILPDDFQKAKDFIYNVMMYVWKTCFDCDFAVVQYGNEIRTELSLLDNKDGAKAMEKVKEIKQLGKITKTASAIHHVLTTIFVPENGSKSDSKKMIIVLSDGKILGDSMSLTDVLNMPQMKGIIRFAIGVGDALLSDEEAVQEMKDIADPNRFFNVSNYAALDDILSQLEQNIIEGIEGIRQGAGFQFQLAEAGFSSHILPDKSVLFGAVGAYDWSGGLILNSDNTVKFLNTSNNGPKFSYLGYSVTSAHLPTKTLYLSGAPRYNLTGGVFVFEGSETYVLQGEQVGSYHGSVLCVLDIDMNGYTDHLLVGAPHFHQDGEEGKVLVYRLNQQEGFGSVYMELQGDTGQTFARFGAAIASIGDIDRNKYSDVAIGAPLESDGSGSIYIYNGFKHGLKRSQKISSSDFGMKLVHFGQSVSSITNTAQRKPYIAVGSRGRVTVFQTIPVITFKPIITADPAVIPFSLQEHKTSYKHKIKFFVCFDTKKGRLQTETLNIQYQIHLDFGVNKKRLSVDGSTLLKSTFLLSSDADCTTPINLEYLGCYDCFSPIKIKLDFSLAPNPNGIPIRILDIFTPTEIFGEILFENDCKAEICRPQITLADSKISENLIIIGETQSLSISFNLTNTEDPSYMTTLTFTYPSILSLKKAEGHCPVRNDSHIQCLPLHPEPIFKKGAKTSVFISWQLSDTKSVLHHLTNSEIIATLTSENRGAQDLDYKIFQFDVMYSLPIQLTGKSSPQRFHIEEGGKTDTSQLQFIFEFVGENKYGAIIDVTINITKKAFNTDMTINYVTPKECFVPKTKTVETLYFITCTLKELQKIIIDAKVSIHDVQDKSDKITAVAQYSFDETIYTSKNTFRTVPVEVIITKLAVTSSKGAIIGGSTGGLLLLIIIIIILIKCGFFRRRRKMDQVHGPN